MISHDDEVSNTQQLPERQSNSSRIPSESNNVSLSEESGSSRPQSAGDGYLANLKLRRASTAKYRVQLPIPETDPTKTQHTKDITIAGLQEQLGNRAQTAPTTRKYFFEHGESRIKSARERKLLYERIDPMSKRCIAVDSKLLFGKLEELADERDAQYRMNVGNSNVDDMGSEDLLELNDEEVSIEMHQKYMRAIKSACSIKPMPPLSYYLNKAYATGTRPTTAYEVKSRVRKRPVTAPALAAINDKEFMEQWIIRQGRKLNSRTSSLVTTCPDIMSTTPNLKRNGAPTLSDWRVYRKYVKKHWNPDDFSVKTFLKTYVDENSLDFPPNATFRRVVHHPMTRRPTEKSNNARESVSSMQSRRVTSSDSLPSEITDSTSTGTSRRQSQSVRYTSASRSTRPLLEDYQKYKEKRKEKVQMLQVLKKSPHARTEEDTSILQSYLKDYKAFLNLSTFVLRQLCGVMNLNKYEPGRAIFKQGEIGTAWYIILSGDVSVQITKTGKLEDLFKVAHLTSGDGFGELALINDSPRKATIVTETRVELIRVEKADYNRIMKFNHEKAMKEKIFFMLRFQMFQDWTAASLKPFAQIATWRKYNAHDVIIEEGTEQHEFFCIRNGLVRVIKKTKNGRKIDVGTYEREEYFGEEAILNDEKKDQVARYTVVAAPLPNKANKSGFGCVEVLVLPVFNVKDNLKPFLEPTRLSHVSEADVEEIEAAKLEQKKWMKVRRRQMDTFVKEFTRDPNMNLTLFKKQARVSKKARWKI